MLRKLSRRKDKRGDTIVEVLIAVAIVSAVLVTAYAVTNRNIQSSQAAQEQSYAQKIAQRQVELLRGAANRPADGSCLDDSGNKVSGAACSQTVGGATYVLSITRANPTDPYSVKVHWDVLGGGAADVIMYYRVAE